MNSTNTKAIAMYVFKQSIKNHTRFILESHTGVDIPNFPAVWTSSAGKDKAGKKYIGYRLTGSKPKQGHRFFMYTFELAGSKTFTGVNFNSEYPYQVFGDSKNIGRNEAVLIQFSTDWQTVTIAFYNTPADEAATLYQKWVSGELCETLDTDILPLPIDEKKPMTKNEHR